jgi:dihydroxy-acid dehydratase
MVFYLTFRFSLGLCLLVMGRHRTKQLIRALVQNGDRICLDAAARRLELLVSDDELARRRAALQLPVTSPNRGYGKLFHDHVVQAPGGVDFDFLQGVDPADADAGV